MSKILGQLPTVILGISPEFPQVNVAGGNQDKATSLPWGVLAICFLYYMASRTEWNKKLVEQDSVG